MGDQGVGSSSSSKGSLGIGGLGFGLGDWTSSHLTFQSLGVLLFALLDSSTWKWPHYLGWFVLMTVAMEGLGRIVLLTGNLFQLAKPGIKVRGKTLEMLATVDLCFIIFNKVITTLFAYHLLCFAWNSPYVPWSLEKLTWGNTLLALIALFVVYDLPYTLFHRILHLRSLYALVHKHHHRQMAPFRGQIDAINVHPFEFVMGEYNHILALFLVAHYLLPTLGGVHVLTLVAFILTGGILASLNHTRFDVSIFSLYKVKYHDLHHWYPTANYGQVRAFDYSLPLSLSPSLPLSLSPSLPPPSFLSFFLR
jgi:sterol desaturase/sphingolipid hydroxylase (fatty acid hydroxylase superfamily)